MPSQKIETGHQDTVHDVAMDYYGKRVATASSDTTIKIIGVSNNASQHLATLIGHQGPVWQVVWAHPKFGSILASCSYDGRVIIWKEGNQNEWTQAHVFSDHKSSVNSIAWAPHELGLCLACGSSDGISLSSLLVSWAPSMAPGALVGSGLLDPVQKLVSGGCDNTVKVWKLYNGNWKMDCFPALQMHTDWVRDVAWAPNLGLPKSTIASASQDGTVVIWTVAKEGDQWEGKVLKDFKTPVWRVSWSLTGNLLAVADGNNNVTLWKEAVDGEWQQECQVHSAFDSSASRITSIVFKSLCRPCTVRGRKQVANSTVDLFELVRPGGRSNRSDSTDAASRLGVERRRIYDIVNILESVGRGKPKNQYSWKGFGAIPRALEELKEEGLREKLQYLQTAATLQKYLQDWEMNEMVHFFKFIHLVRVQGVGMDNLPVNLRVEMGVSKHSEKPSPRVEGQWDGEKAKEVISGCNGMDMATMLNILDSLNCEWIDNRREKSLGLLTQNFIKLFLCSDADLISLDCAAMALLGDGHNSTAMRNNSAAKVRRLYDIANVLSSMNLIEKTPHPESRKPAFRWLGVKGKLKNASATAMDVQQPKKRVFGTDVTNYSLKRNKADSSTDWKSNQNINMPLHMKPGDLENNGDGLEQNSKHSSKGFVFGPFTPASAPGVGESANKIMKPTQDWESLASTFRPQYRNQATELLKGFIDDGVAAISDLFGHYVEAWKSWALNRVWNQCYMLCTQEIPELTVNSDDICLNHPLKVDEAMGGACRSRENEGTRRHYLCQAQKIKDISVFIVAQY
ncbi:Protein transport protein SEC13-like B [Vitis vinifera]|uniref:Protein transport protein SEC13-like B n=2 Tax=Magnoliopsida TaxID=3398 RepID=A0A438CL18_VITVI|nr:Protein transport protein SEC13-like B [Vitis vinifera]